MSEIIKIAATVIRDGRFLIVKSDKDSFWKNLGGKIEGGESEIDCLKREVKEELGLSIKSTPKLLLETPFTPAISDPNIKVKIKFYLTEVEGDPIIVDKSELSEWHWLSKVDLDKSTFPLSPQILQYLIPELLRLDLLK